MATTYANLLYHLVFSTKNRAPLIRAEIRDPLYEYMGGIIRGEGGVLLEAGGMPDHVHLLAKIKTDMAVAALVQKVKGKSSKWMNKGDGSPGSFEWQVGYGIFSVSASLAEKVRQYIRLQEEHHRRVSFRDELVSHDTGLPTTSVTCSDESACVPSGLEGWGDGPVLGLKPVETPGFMPAPLRGFSVQEIRLLIAMRIEGQGASFVPEGHRRRGWGFNPR